MRAPWADWADSTCLETFLFAFPGKEKRAESTIALEEQKEAEHVKARGKQRASSRRRQPTKAGTPCR